MAAKNKQLILKGKRHWGEQIWETAQEYARKGGREIVEKLLVLYYVFDSPSTPTAARLTIIGAIIYFCSPVDLIPDFIPGAGHVDDLGVLIAAALVIKDHITPEWNYPVLVYSVEGSTETSYSNCYTPKRVKSNLFYLPIKSL